MQRSFKIKKIQKAVIVFNDICNSFSVLYLSKSDGKVDLDDFDLEQIVKSLKDPHLNHVVTTSQSLQQFEALLKNSLQSSVLLL